MVGTGFIMPQCALGLIECWRSKCNLQLAAFTKCITNGTTVCLPIRWSKVLSGIYSTLTLLLRSISIVH